MFQTYIFFTFVLRNLYIWNNLGNWGLVKIETVILYLILLKLLFECSVPDTFCCLSCSQTLPFIITDLCIQFIFAPFAKVSHNLHIDSMLLIAVQQDKLTECNTKLIG